MNLFDLVKRFSTPENSQADGSAAVGMLEMAFAAVGTQDLPPEQEAHRRKLLLESCGEVLRQDIEMPATLFKDANITQLMVGYSKAVTTCKQLSTIKEKLERDVEAGKIGPEILQMHNNTLAIAMLGMSKMAEIVLDLATSEVE